MAFKRTLKKYPSLATQYRAKKTLFLPMAAAKAEGLALRLRLALNVVSRGQGAAVELRVLSQAIMMNGLIADIEPGSLSDHVLVACETFMEIKIASARYSPWGITPSKGWR